MTSPTVNFYSSTDANAPVLNGSPGSLITVLNACLVNGYGSKPGAGWTLLGQGTASSNPYTALYQMGSGSKCVLYVNDNYIYNYGNAGVSAALTGGLPTSVWGSNLVGSFPSSGNLCLTKSNRASQSVAVAWWVIATSNAVYIITQPGIYFGPSYSPAALAVPSVFTFGDLFGIKPGDQYPCHIQGDTAGTVWMYYYGSCGISKVGSILNPTNGNYPFLFLATTGNSLTQSPAAAKIMDQSFWYQKGDTYQQPSTYLGPGCPYNGADTYLSTPNPYDNGYYMSPFRISVQSDGLRGYLPGMWAPQQYNPFPMYQPFSSPSGQFAGRTFFAVPSCVYNSSSVFCNSDNANTMQSQTTYGQIVFEISSTWT